MLNYLDVTDKVFIFASKRSVMNQLTNEEPLKQMADMKGFDEQMPCIGIFASQAHVRYNKSS